MPYISVDDFFEKTKDLKSIAKNREMQKNFALQMKEGNADARQALINGYIPMVAQMISRVPEKYQSLRMIYNCIDILEKGVDSFNFLQDSETFVHYLSNRLRMCIARCRFDKQKPEL